MPLQRRLPKRGFTNPHRTEYAVVNVSDLERFDEGAEITPDVLLEARVVRDMKDGVAVLGDGDLSKRLIVKAHRFSRSAAEKIKAAGGEAEVIQRA